MKQVIILVITGIIFYGCEKPPSYSNVPIITSTSLTTNVVRSFTDTSADALSLPDSLTVQINFTDGNGALGVLSGDSIPDAFLIDSRVTPSGQHAKDGFSIPYITPNGNVKAISGTISFHLSSQLVGNEDGLHPDWDTIYYSIYVVDRNGNASNTVKTPLIYIKNN